MTMKACSILKRALLSLRLTEIWKKKKNRKIASVKMCLFFFSLTGTYIYAWWEVLLTITTSNSRRAITAYGPALVYNLRKHHHIRFAFDEGFKLKHFQPRNNWINVRGLNKKSHEKPRESFAQRQSTANSPRLTGWCLPTSLNTYRTAVHGI